MTAATKFPPAAMIPREDFAWIRQMVRERAAIVIEDGKEYLVEARLAQLAHRESLGTVANLIARLRSQPQSGLSRQVVEAMTINETSFFRDWRPYEALRKELLPELIARNAATRTLNIWSAACSSGQEPYSLAILLREHFPQLNGWAIRIVASDISQEMIDKARSGIYSQLEANRGMPAPLLVKYFQRNGLDWQLKDEIRRMVQFIPANLAGNWPELPRLDVVMLRNVMIYFDVETKKRILTRVRSLLRPSGVLFLGGSETTLNLDASYNRVTLEGSCCYRPAGG